MMKFIRIFLLVLIVIGIGLLSTTQLWLVDFNVWLLNHSSMARDYADTKNKELSLIKPASKVEKSPTPASKTSDSPKITKHEVLFLSSTIKIADFNIVVNCENFNPKSVNIFRNSTTTQTLLLHSSLTGIPQCLPAEVRDINFDGNSDFMVGNSNGSGGGSYAYWLFNPETQQFYCPQGDYKCSFSNPSFDIASKTVISRHPSGAGIVIIDTYQAIEGKLVLVKHEEIGR